MHVITCIHFRYICFFWTCLHTYVTIVTIKMSNIPLSTNFPCSPSPAHLGDRAWSPLTTVWSTACGFTACPHQSWASFTELSFKDLGWRFLRFISSNNENQKQWKSTKMLVSS